MGPDNMALWKVLNIGSLANTEFVVCSIPHPVRPNARLWFLPDTVHLYKNIVTRLTSNQFFYLSADIVDEAGLTTNKVELNHIQELLDFEEPFELKVAYRLKQENLGNKKTFQKMRVSNPASVFCKRTEAGLRDKAKPEKSSAYDATIFFVALVAHWFALVSNLGGETSASAQQQGRVHEGCGLDQEDRKCIPINEDW